MKKTYFAVLLCLWGLGGFAQNINKIEYFIDADPGYGSGVDVFVTAGTPVTANFNVSLPNTVADGFHFLSVRARGVPNNTWSVVGVRPFFKETLSTAAVPNITALEYFIDNDPGYGLGTAITVTVGSPLTRNFTVALPSISDGFHFLTIRARDVNNLWSVVGVRPFFKETLSTAAVPNITALEYFIDNDPGYGLGTAVTVTAGSPVTRNFTVALPSISDGFHFLTIRARDVNNRWSVVGVRPFFKENLSTSNIPNVIAMEYFLDADPGFGLGTAVTVTAGSPVTRNFTVALASVTDGFHTLSIRAKDVNNKWSVVGVRPFYKEILPSATIPNIVAMEYFIDADPGYGSATALTVTAGSPVLPVSQNVNISLGSLANGIHKLSIRAKDVNNKWSVVGIRDFAVQDNVVVAGTTPASWCKNASFNIPFTATGTFIGGNVFTAQLSNALGSFASPTSIGTVTGTSSGTISATIPNTVALGTGYRIRLISSLPAITNSPTKTIDVTLLCQCLLNASLATGNWGTAGIWSCGHVPIVTEPVQISSGHTVTLDVNGAAKSLDLRGILNQQASKILTVQGN
jgi:ADP-ribose pyrophosphatase YjhB (NUDIX family)